MVIDFELALRIRSRCERMLKRAEPDIPELERQANWEALGGLLKGACRNALQLAMIELRCNHDVEAARRYFLKARDLSSFFEGVSEGVVAASDLDIPIYCCLLSGDFESAKRLAEIISSGKLKVIPGSHFDVHAQILSAFILGDLGCFERWLLDFERLEQSYWWGRQKIYFDLYRSVIVGDEVAFSILLCEAVALFGDRRFDKEFGNQLGEYGGLEYNQFSIDFMSVGIAVVAKEKGLIVSIDSDYFPAKLIA